MKFKKRINEAIKDSKYNQKELAKILGISEGNISNWKKGRNLPSIDILFKICIILEESADYLLGLEDDFGNKIYIKDSFNNGNYNGNINIGNKK